jgi:molybdenum cofactor synthesis domain-containing protein
MSTNIGASFELLFIGNELLIGKVLNTNSQWLTRNITLLGGTCSRITVVRDKIEEISRVVNEILKRSPRFLIISGGLGPTYDDMTLEGLSRALNKPLRVDKTALSWVTQKYQELKNKGLIEDSSIIPSRTKMATLPLTSKPLPNPVGTAPGVLISKGETKIICLPGVPSELEAIFEDSVKKEIIKEVGERCFVESTFMVKGIGESAMAPIIEDVMMKYSPYVYVKSHPKHGTPDVTVEFHLTAPNNVRYYNKGREFFQHKIMETQKDLEDKIKKLGGHIINHA